MIWLHVLQNDYRYRLTFIISRKYKRRKKCFFPLWDFLGSILKHTIQHVLFVHLTPFISAVSLRLSGLWHRAGGLPFPLTCVTHHHILQTYPVQHREAPSLFPVWGYYEHSCCEHICTGPWWTCTLISRACIFRNETAGSQHTQRFSFSNYCQTIFQSACTHLHCYQLSMIFK